MYLKVQTILQYLKKALNYDRSLFSKERNQYLDLRYYPEQAYSHAWAHGSAGIGLSRLLIAELLPDYPGLKEEIEVCRANTNHVMPSNVTYTMNGGFSGNLEMLMAMNNYCGVNSDYIDTLVMDKVNYYSQNPERMALDNNHIQLLLNMGISGFAYTLMRYLSPCSVPSCLVLGINTNFGGKHLYAK